MKIRDRFTNLSEELYILLERTSLLNEEKILDVSKEQAELLKKYWWEIHYILSEKKMEMTFNDEFTKIKITKYD